MLKLKLIIIFLLCLCGIVIYGCNNHKINIEQHVDFIEVKKRDGTPFTNDELDKIFNNINYEGASVSVDGGSIFINK